MEEQISLLDEADANIKKKKHKFEFSKVLCVFAIVVLTTVAIYCITEYYHLVNYAIETGSCVIPDSSLPIAGVTGILATVLSYCLYQGALKTSLNKNKLTVDENGIIKPIFEKLFDEEEDMQ